MRAEISEDRIVLRDCVGKPGDWWGALLDELKSHHIPSRYPRNQRMLALANGDAFIYLTEKTVSSREALGILRNHGFVVYRDVAFNPLCPAHNTPMGANPAEAEYRCLLRACAEHWNEERGHFQRVNGVLIQHNVKRCTDCSAPLYFAKRGEVQTDDEWLCANKECPSKD